jgi:hypothetical protein
MAFMAAANPFNPNPNPNPNPIISAYYQTRAAHTGVVTSNWLAQAQAVVGRHSDDLPAPENDLKSPSGFGKTFSVINDFNNWRKQPDLAEAVAAIRALASDRLWSRFSGGERDLEKRKWREKRNLEREKNRGERKDKIKEKGKKEKEKKIKIKREEKNKKNNDVALMCWIKLFFIILNETSQQFPFAT